jgi:hypothetical protein
VSVGGDGAERGSRRLHRGIRRRMHVQYAGFTLCTSTPTRRVRPRRVGAGHNATVQGVLRPARIVARRRSLTERPVKVRHPTCRPANASRSVLFGGHAKRSPDRLRGSAGAEYSRRRPQQATRSRRIWGGMRLRRGRPSQSLDREVTQLFGIAFACLRQFYDIRGELCAQCVIARNTKRRARALSQLSWNLSTR